MGVDDKFEDRPDGGPAWGDRPDEGPVWNKEAVGGLWGLIITGGTGVFMLGGTGILVQAV